MDIRSQLERLIRTWGEDPFPTMEIDPRDPNLQIFTDAAHQFTVLSYKGESFWVYDYRYDPGAETYVFVLDLGMFDELNLRDLT
jgi:hypothetical protein